MSVFELSCLCYHSNKLLNNSIYIYNVDRYNGCARSNIYGFRRLAFSVYWAMLFNYILGVESLLVKTFIYLPAVRASVV